MTNSIILFLISTTLTCILASHVSLSKKHYMSLREGSSMKYASNEETKFDNAPLSTEGSNKLESSYTDMEHYIGGEYTPSGASNELWLAFYTRYRAQVETDLANARRRLSTTVLRIFLHSLLWESNSNELLTNLDDFLGIADKNDMKVGFVFFDSCWSNTGASTTVECEETPGVHNSCWMQSPQLVNRTGNVSRYEPYVSGVTSHFSKDPRIAWWEIYNEPDLSDSYVVQLREAAYSWAKAQQPIAPVMSCCDYNSSGVSDVSDIHRYDLDFSSSWAPAAFANVSKGAIFTEAGCRSFQAPFTGDAGTPLAVIHFLETLRLRRDVGLEPYVPGALLSWELFVGNSNTRWHWGSSPGTPEPAIAWCGMLLPDGSPVSFTESARLRQYVSGINAFLFYEDFMGPVTATLVDGKPSLTLSRGEFYWASVAPGVDISNDVLVEFTFYPSIIGDKPTGTVELVLQANNLTDRYIEKSQLPCDSSLLMNTNVCSGAEGETNFIISPDEPNFVNLCASACCNRNETCGAWIVLPGTNFNDKNCTCENSPCTCCWLKPLDCDDTTPMANCTSGFLNLPPEPIPILSGYVVSVNYSSSVLSLSRVSNSGDESLLGLFNLSSIENGLVNGWNIVRVAMENDGGIDVYMNPMFKDTGFVGNSSDAGRIPHAIMPRISVVDASPLPSGNLAIGSTGSSTRVDYISVLPLSVL